MSIESSIEVCRQPPESPGHEKFGADPIRAIEQIRCCHVADVAKTVAAERVFSCQLSTCTIQGNPCGLQGASRGMKNAGIHFY